jgi:hypothetical protein
MPEPGSSRRPLRLLIALAVVAVVVACGSQVAPTASAPSGSGVAGSGSPNPSSDEPSSPAGRSASPGATEQSGIATPAPTDDLASPPPVGDPQDDEACLAVIPRADVEAAVGESVADIVAIGTDPAVSLTCTYALANGGSLLVTTAAGDPAAGFQSSLDLATSYGQNPVTMDGLGDEAFYATAADRWPEQVVFVKGPALVRLVNQTSATIGEVAFAALASTAADAIRAEIPPAP